MLSNRVLLDERVEFSAHRMCFCVQGSSVQMVQEKILRQHGIKWHQLKITMVCSHGSLRNLAPLYAPAPRRPIQQPAAYHFTWSFLRVLKPAFGA